jgi:hypothetical protein
VGKEANAAEVVNGEGEERDFFSIDGGNDVPVRDGSLGSPF